MEETQSIKPNATISIYPVFRIFENPKMRIDIISDLYLLKNELSLLTRAL